MIINTHKLKKIIMNEQDIHIHIGGGGSVSSSTPSTSSSPDSSSSTPSSSSSTPSSSSASSSTPSSTSSSSQQSSQSKNNYRTQPEMIRQSSRSGNSRNTPPSRVTPRTGNLSRPSNINKLVKKSKVTDDSKTEMKEIYVRDHIRRIGRRPTQQDIDKTFKHI